MFKTQFNALYVSVMDYILDEKTEYTFETPLLEISHYNGVVDEYTTLMFNLTLLHDQLDDNNLQTEINDLKTSLDDVLENYKIRSVAVRSYLNDIRVLTVKTGFIDRLYRYEQSLVSEPLIKVDVEVIQQIISAARAYTQTTDTYYFYTNNPYIVDEVLHIVVPVRMEYDTDEALLTSLYTYMYELYTQYMNINEGTLNSMIPLSKGIEEHIYSLIDVYNDAMRNRYIITDNITATRYYDDIESIKHSLMEKVSHILDMGVYRFTNLVTLFEPVADNINYLLSGYESHELYVKHLNDVKFDGMLDKLSEYITLIEDGKVQTDVQYILSDITLKELVDDIIELSRMIKRSIVYTQQYHASGFPKTLEYPFYQTTRFLTSIKTYYYQLMSDNSYRYSNIGIDDYGDHSLDDLRISYKQQLATYKKYIAKEINYMNDFEFNTYIDSIITLQNTLKIVGVSFFDKALKISPPTFLPEIQTHYLSFIKGLETDVDEIRSNRVNTKLDTINDKDKTVCYEKLVFMSRHMEKIEEVTNLSDTYVFIGFSDFIKLNIRRPMDAFFTELKEFFRKEQYKAFINYYDVYYHDNIIDFNMLYALEKFSTSVKSIFVDIIDTSDRMYVREYANGVAREEFSTVFGILEDLFDDDTYKVSRNEIFTELDVVYEFVIASRPNEKTFLINEKNLKKLYFDNQFMKINYIRWYHKILQEFDRYTLIDGASMSDNELYTQHKLVVDEFKQKGRIEAALLTQNRALSIITKMIKEYSSDTTYQDFHFTSEIIRNIDEYNYGLDGKYITLQKAITILENIVAVVVIDKKRDEYEITHKAQWLDIINRNEIPDPEKVSYDSMEVFKGTVPYTVELKSKLENAEDASGNPVVATYKWFIDDTIDIIKDGHEIAHTFYTEGYYVVRCEITFATGETRSRFVEFELAGPDNTDRVKQGRLHYAPLEEHPHQPKITFYDSETEQTYTVPFNFTGTEDVYSMIRRGNISVNSYGGVLFEENVGYIILGFDGVVFPGQPYDYRRIFAEEDQYVLPNDTEFLFDFKISTPISGDATINIENSRYVTFMAKVPPSVTSIYDIEDVSIYQTIGTAIPVDTGDRLIFRNKYDRYAIVEVNNIVSFTESYYVGEDGKIVSRNGEDVGRYYYYVDFSYYVNTTLKTFERNDFTPTTTTQVIPTIIFKLSVRERFNALISRLEEINGLYASMVDVVDVEYIEATNVKINFLVEENNKYYLFEELDRINMKFFSLKRIYDELNDSFTIDYTVSSDEFTERVNAYSTHITETKTFEESMYAVHAYNFKQNVIDLKVLMDLYQEQQTLIKIFILTFEYNVHDKEFYINSLKDLQLFDTTDFIPNHDNISLQYNDFLVAFVLKLRTMLYRLKLVINFPIMTDGTYMAMSEKYYRLIEDLGNGTWAAESEDDLFLLNKKIELRYGYESGKIETGLTYTDFISELIQNEKSLFGNGLSRQNTKDISEYIQIVESTTVEEYDDFFMIPFWVDYLKKNVREGD